MATAKYIMVNGDTIIAIVYEDEKYGRTMVVTEKLNPNHGLKVYELGVGTISDIDLIDYLHSCLPEVVIKKMEDKMFIIDIFLIILCLQNIFLKIKAREDWSGWLFGLAGWLVVAIKNIR